MNVLVESMAADKHQLPVGLLSVRSRRTATYAVLLKRVVLSRLGKSYLESVCRAGLRPIPAVRWPLRTGLLLGREGVLPAKRRPLAQRKTATEAAVSVDIALTIMQIFCVLLCRLDPANRSRRARWLRGLVLIKPQYNHCLPS